MTETILVVGRPDDIRDEVPVAFVVAADPSSRPSVEKLDAWCEQRLAKATTPATFPGRGRELPLPSTTSSPPDWDSPEQSA